jgi:hypothetical protein
VRRYSSLPNIRCATANSRPTEATYTIVVKKALTGPTEKITSGARESVLGEDVR